MRLSVVRLVTFAGSALVFAWLLAAPSVFFGPLVMHVARAFNIPHDIRYCP